MSHKNVLCFIGIYIDESGILLSRCSNFSNCSDNNILDSNHSLHCPDLIQRSISDSVRDHNFKRNNSHHLIIQVENCDSPRRYLEPDTPVSASQIIANTETCHSSPIHTCPEPFKNHSNPDSPKEKQHKKKLHSAFHPKIKQNKVQPRKRNCPENSGKFRAVYAGIRELGAFLMGIGACRGLERSDSFEKHQRALANVFFIFQSFLRTFNPIFVILFINYMFNL